MSVYVFFLGGGGGGGWVAGQLHYKEFFIKGLLSLWPIYAHISLRCLNYP